MIHSTRQTVIFGNYLTWAVSLAPMAYFAPLISHSPNIHNNPAEWMYTALYGDGPGLITTWLLIIFYLLTPIAATWCIIKGFRIRRAVLYNSKAQPMFWISFGLTFGLLLMWLCSLTYGPLFLFHTYLAAGPLY